MMQNPQSPLAKSGPKLFAAGPARTEATQAPRFREMRLRKHADYQRVYQSTRKQFSNSLTWFVSARTEADETAPAGPRVGLTAGKVLGKAHERNRIKRRLRDIMRRHIQELPAGVDLILHPKRSVLTMDSGKLEAEVLRIFRQAAGQMRAGQRQTGQAQPAQAATAARTDA